MSSKRVFIIGGGLVGLGTALKLSRVCPAAQVTVLEKEDRLCAHQSGHNSGVLHSGLYYKPGSLKARMAVSGIKEMVAFCKEHSVPHEICGKLVVAADESEVLRLRDLQERGTRNGLEGLQWLNGEQMREIEPHAGGVAGLRVPQEGIVDYAKVSEALQKEIEANGGKVVLKAKVTALELRSGEWSLDSTAGGHTADFIINCAGLYCDRVSQLAGERREVRIVPFRGEYYKLLPQRERLVRALIYPVPDPGFPFLGVHFTRMVHGGVEAGPNAVLSLKREGYGKTDFSPRDAWDTLSYPGFWILASRYWRTGAGEIYRSLNKNAFVRALQRLLPDLRREDLAPGGSGVRAQAVDARGNLLDDFCLETGPGAIHVLNAPSPAATASLPIGEAIATRVRAMLAE